MEILAKTIKKAYQKNKKLLSKRERDIIERYYGFSGLRHTLQEIGNIYKITRERVRQIKYVSLGKINSLNTNESSKK